MVLFKYIIVVFIISSACVPLLTQAYQTKINLVFGTYSKEKSEGIYTSTLDLASGELSKAELAFKSKDPTYLAVSKNGVIYGALRGGNGLIAALKPNSDASFSLISSHEIYGKSPCYISLSPNEKYIASANYNGGNVSIFRVSPSGGIQSNPTIVTHSGKSVNPKRQKSPHPHWVQWSPYNENILYVADLGIDKVMQYHFNYETGQVDKKNVAYESKPGAGPRHIAFHPTKSQAYVLNELSNTVTFVNIGSDGKFTRINETSTLPQNYTKHNKSAHISINKAGTVLYTSNRGLNSIAVFNINNDGTITLVENTPTGGNWPRFFKLFEQYGFILVGNLKSNNITVFRIKADGRLEKTDQQLSVDQVTFIDQY